MGTERLHPLEGIARQNIRITDLVVTPLSYRLKREEQWPDGDDHFVIWQTTTVIVKVRTDVGLVGIGGASRYSGPERMMAYAEEVIRPSLLGKNPFDVEALSAAKCAHGATNIWAGVDTALWDIIGQAVGQPLYKLLAIDGEPQTRLRVYASGGEFSWLKGSRFPGPDNLIQEALRHQAAGYTAFKFRMGAGFNKFGITMQEYIPYLRRIRAAVGPEMDLIQEANCRWSVEQCLEIAPTLEELGFLWFEEPTKRWGDDAIANYLRVKEALPTVKVSGGEGRASRSELAEWVDRGAYDIVQQGCDDAGLTEAWHMARMAAARGVICCPHNWQGGMVTIANAHLMAAIPNRLLLESNMTANPLKENLFKEPFRVVDGYLDVPDKPGLGVELREDLEEEFPYLPGPWNKSEAELEEER
ncbi:MAG: mandelate racemase/muconate lactonizing enzyme family protein [Chloroflexi bacterium]|nr:mandelate racemase/muconate lactonizing enzyme family protein [Chloroflexota bacterium]